MFNSVNGHGFTSLPSSNRRPDPTGALERPCARTDSPIHRFYLRIGLAPLGRAAFPRQTRYACSPLRTATPRATFKTVSNAYRVDRVYRPKISFQKNVFGCWEICKNRQCLRKMNLSHCVCVTGCGSTQRHAHGRNLQRNTHTHTPRRRCGCTPREI